MASSKNKANKKSASIFDINPKGDMKKAALKTLAVTGLSVIGGGLAGAALGKPSFLVGLVLAGVGYYKGVSWLAPMGLGMMSTSHLNPDTKSRVLSFKDSLLQKTYLDKIIPSKKASSNRLIADESTEGFGSTQANLNALDDVEKQLNASAKSFYGRSGNAPSRSLFTPIEGGIDELDFSGM